MATVEFTEFNNSNSTIDEKHLNKEIIYKYDIIIYKL